MTAAPTPPAASQRRSAWPLTSLLLLALACGVGWRLELEWRTGWASLEWINVFHWAIPVGLAGFIAWTLAVTRVRRPALFAAALLGFASVGYVLLDFIARFFFQGGVAFLFIVLLDRIPGGRSLLSNPQFTASPGGLLFGIYGFMGSFWILFPLVFCLLCRAFGFSIRWPLIVFSCVLFVLSWPAAVYLRSFIETIGSDDLIHALKSGFVIPFLVVSLGLPILLARPAATAPAAPEG